MAMKDLLIIGAGPSGLSAAIAAKRANLSYEVVEQGSLVNSIYHFPPQMVFFTTPELLEIGGVPFVSPYDKPTRAEALRYYRKVTEAFELSIRFNETVTSVKQSVDESSGTKSFIVSTQTALGETRTDEARNVILAIGYYDEPNYIDVPGESLPHVHHYYSEPHPYYRQNVVIVGGGNSAAEAALEMFRAGVNVTLVHRSPELKKSIKYWVRPDIENRIQEKSITAYFSSKVQEIRQDSVIISDPNGVTREIAADAVFLLTGYHTDWDFMRAAGIELGEKYVPSFNPETFETNVAGLFLAGGAICGRETGNVFIENGRFHGERIVATIVARR